MLLKGTNGSALKEKEFLLVVYAGEEMQRKTLLTDASGRASFELDTSGWNEEVSLHVSEPCPTPLGHPGFSKDHRGFLTQNLPASP